MALDRVVLKLLLVGTLRKFSITIHLLLLPHVKFLALPLPLNHFHLASFSLTSLSFTVLVEHGVR